MNKVMRKVIRLEEEEEKKKPIEFTHYQNHSGWAENNNFINSKISEVDKIVYLGKCETDGDMFALYLNDNIAICKGHLNDGVY